MRNLKRALALALSSVMLMGMMVVGSSAAGFPDVKDHEYQEAIELVQMLEIMNGDQNGNFNPEKVITRNEMAVILCDLLDLKLNGSHPFTDVPAWADEFVGAVYTAGITAGTSATTYGGNDTLTAAQAGLMVMKALGYFEFEGEFGGNWKLATVKKAIELNMFEDIDANVDEGLTRAETAQLVMNALDEFVVIAEEIGGMSVEGNGITVTEKARYNHYTYRNDTLGCTETLMTKLFGRDLTTNENAYDVFGRPATTWTYTGGDETQTITVADDAAIVITAAKDDDAITKLLKDYTFGATEAVYIDGAVKDADVAKTDLDTYTGNGVTVEIYADKFNVERIVIVNEYLGKVTAVTAADEDTGAERTVTVNSKAYETEDFARKDYVIYTMADGVIKSMKLADTVEGKVTATAASYIKLDDVSYKANGTAANNVNLGATAYALGNTVNVYVDSNGYIIGLDDVIKTPASLEDYVVVTNAAGRDTFGAQVVKVIYADGTTATLTVDATSTEAGFVAAPVVDTLYTVEKTDDGYEFYAAPTATDAGFDATVASGSNNKDKATLGGANVADDAVIFVKNTTSGKFSVISGAELKKLATGEATIVNAYANKATSGFESIELAYVTATTTTALDDVAYGYVVADLESVKNADGKTVESVTFWNGTKNVTVLAKADMATGLVKGDFFSYELNSKGELANVDEIYADTDGYYVRAVKAYDGTNIKFVGTFEITEDTVVMYVDTKNVKGVAEGEIVLADEVFAADGETVVDYVENVIIKGKDGEVVVLFVDINNEMIMNAQAQ